MNTKAVKSYDELKAGITSAERSFLLLYKSGSEQSDCALNRISSKSATEAYSLFVADVNQVRDIHPRLEVTTAPSLVVFDRGKVMNVIKGCQTESAYQSILAGRELGNNASGNTEKTKQVTVYTTPTCTWCTTLKTYLDQHGIRYREVNVASDTAAAEAMVRKSGQQGVPQTEISGQMIVGFDKNRINQLLEIK
ncbi:MAG: glutaredoxin domain-containing protein [Bacteroidota bacterium]